MQLAAIDLCQKCSRKECLGVSIWHRQALGADVQQCKGVRCYSSMGVWPGRGVPMGAVQENNNAVADAARGHATARVLPGGAGTCPRLGGPAGVLGSPQLSSSSH